MRRKLYNKYKPPPKTLRSAAAAKPSTSKAQADSDSSSDDDNFVNPNALDLGSEFFTKAGPSDGVEPPQFDCNVGMQLSDSESDDDEDTGNTSLGRATKPRDLNSIHEFNQNLERAKARMANAKFQASTSTSANADQGSGDFDVAALLSMGEASTSTKPSSQRSAGSKKKKNTAELDSDDEWEEVEGEPLLKNFLFSVLINWLFRSLRIRQAITAH